MPQPREALFISHANPDDNAFALWLGTKLAAMGYEVWADVMRLHGGADWSRELERALREKAIKMLAVCTPIAVDKDGVRNEIEIASQLAKELNDSEFIIPLRLKAYKSPFRIARAQYIDFSHSWAAGLAELVELLSTTYTIPKRPGRPIEAWFAAQSSGATRLIERRERLTSNWLRLQSVPSAIHYCEPPSGFSLGKFQERALHRWPVVPFGAGVLTFATPDAGLLSPDMPARDVVDLSVREFLKNGWNRLGIQGYEARRLFADLGNQAIEAFLHSRGLTPFEGSNGRRVWWGDVRTAPLTQVQFSWEHQKGRRQIVGKSDKRDVFWHYAVMGNIRTAPVQHMRISARLIFSENGMDAIGDSKRMHKLRRSFAKGWRNARWRDMLLAFLWWLADGATQLAVPVSAKQRLVLALPPLSFASAVSVAYAGEEPADEDDPDIAIDDWDEEESSSTDGPSEEALP